MHIPRWLIRGVCSVASDLVHVWFPPHCLLSGTYLGEQPQRVRGISDDALIFHRAAPAASEVYASIVRHIPADDVAVSSAHALWSVGRNTTIDAAVHAIKYAGRRRLARDLGAWLEHLPTIDQLDQSALVVPIPIHPARRRERGYNQAEELALGWCTSSGRTRVTTSTVCRRLNTATQTTLHEHDRLANVAGAFDVRIPSDVAGRRCILVDDVITTGATINACATALLEAGAIRVDAVALCVAV
jgi:ComF family protein